MKPKTNNPEEYNKQLDELAKEAMKCIVSGLYSHPIILGQFDDIAKTNNRPLSQEVAERSYELATVMLKARASFTMKE